MLSIQVFQAERPRAHGLSGWNYLETASHMSRPADKHHTVHMERQLLQALCQETTEGVLRDAAARLLTDYEWREPIHQAIFDSVKNIRPKSPVSIHDELPARVTRKGFPDINWDEFFAPSSLSKQQAEEMIRQLRDSPGSEA